MSQQSKQIIGSWAIWRYRHAMDSTEAINAGLIMEVDGYAVY